MHQTGRCSNGTNFTTSAWFNQPAPIPLPTTGTAYEELPAEVTFPIPGFNEAFHSLYPALDYCSFSAFMGAPSAKVRATPTQTTDIRMMEEGRETASSSSASEPPSSSSPPSSSPSPTSPSQSTIAPAALNSAASQLTSLASLILCGLGASCPALSSPSGATDSSGRTYFFATPSASDGPTRATLGPSNAVPLYTDASGAVVLPLWTTLGADGSAAAATVGGAAVSVGTGGEVVVDGKTVARAAAETSGGGGGSDLSGRSSTGDGGGSETGGGGGGAEGTGGGGGGSSGAAMVRGEGRQGWWVLEGCVGASLLLLVVVL